MDHQNPSSNSNNNYRKKRTGKRTVEAEIDEIHEKNTTRLDLTTRPKTETEFEGHRNQRHAVGTRYSQTQFLGGFRNQL
jgi:hypothetical protein